MPSLRKNIRNGRGRQTRDQSPDDLDRVVDLEKLDERGTAVDSEAREDPVAAHVELEGIMSG